MTEGFKQVCVWPATVMVPGEEEDFEAMFASMGFRVKFIEMIYTYPDTKDGVAVEGTGGRADTFFYIHSEDIPRFAAWRLAQGIRWIEDVLADGSEYDDNQIYPPHVYSYCSWTANPNEEAEDG